ncbi:MAG: alpha-galactosidase [Abditibacteriota bacterium]|nr:alpha-galactosidase [Abditibacteriota bacterium]
MQFIEDFIQNQGAFSRVPDIKVKSHEEAFNVFGYNFRDDFDHPIGTQTQRFDTSLYAHAPSKIVIDVKDFSKMSFYPGIIFVDNVPKEACVFDYQFTVLGDGEEIYLSPVLRSDSVSPFVELNILKYSEITLLAKCLDNKEAFGNIFWGDLCFTTKDGEKVFAGEPENKNFFSFKYNGVSSDELLKKWEKTFKIVNLGPVTRYVTEWTDPETKFVCIIEMHKYEGFSNYWWNLKFANRGDKNSYILSEVKSIDYEFESYKETLVNHALGSTFSATDFQSVTEPVKDKIHVATTGGRSSEGAWPYFRIENPGSGYLIAMGWSGQWYCDFIKTPKGIKCVGGVETFASLLYPGEEIKMASINIMPYEGTTEKAHNVWRDFIRKYNTPGGEDIRVPVCVGAWGAMYADKHREAVDYVVDKEVGVDVYWIDAAWYGEPEGHCITAWEPGWGEQRGNWYENPVAYPEGFGPVTDKVHERGLKFLLWFEMQSARPNTQLTNEHPDWFIKKVIREGKEEDIIDWQFNIGDDKACDWLIDFIDEKIKKWKIDWYREDFNTNPLPYWQYMDTLDRDRVGMTEVKCVDNYWRFWDTLIKRNPGLMIDNCASGGRRLDIEMIGRGVALWQSDYQCYSKVDYMGIQSQNMCLNLWLPYHTGGNVATDNWGYRSCLSTGTQVNLIPGNWNEDHPLEFCEENTAFVKERIEEYREIEDAFYGDYYTHAFAGIDHRGWNVYEMVKDDRGFVMAFRGEDSVFSEVSLKLKGVDPESDYEFTDMDTGAVFTQKGGEILRIVSQKSKESRLIKYRKL